MSLYRWVRVCAIVLSCGLLTAATSRYQPAPVQAEVPKGRAYYESRGDAVWEVPGKEKVLALTFDDGPDPDDTPQILDLLKQYNVKATFFVMGRKVKEHPDIVIREVAEGHEVANHTFTHRVLRSSTLRQIREELSSTQEAIFNVTGIHSRLFRPPQGEFDSRVIAVGREEGLQMVLWSWHQDAHDWSRPGVSRIVRTVTGNVRNGDIILLHDYVSGPTQTVRALKQILPKLTKEGYRFVTVSELLDRRVRVEK